MTHHLPSQVPPGALSARRFRAVRTVLALVLREVATSFGQSPGGYLWAVIKPVAVITVLTLVFAKAFRAPALGTNFPLFYASGFLPFSLYGDMGNKISKALVFSRQLLFYPGVRYIDAILARFLLTLLTQLAIFLLGMGLIHLFYRLNPILDVPAIALSLAMAAALGLGIGTLNCYLKSAFPIWEHFFAILTAPLFILSTIIFTFESVPRDWRGVLWYNPLVHVVGMMRRGFYPSYDAPYVSPLYVFGVALVTLALGLVLLQRFHRDILNM